MSDNGKFQPEKHLRQIKSGQTTQDYLDIKWRIKWFREEFPNGTIDTEEVLVDLDRETESEQFVWSNEKRRSEKVVVRGRGYARFRAIVTNGEGGRATATGSETAADFKDYIEKAETKAIGRALAELGFGTQFVGDELNEGNRIVDSPVDRGQHNSNGSRPAQAQPTAKPAAQPSATPTRFDEEDDDDSEEGDEPAATKQQLDSIEKLCQRLGKPVERPATFAQARETIGRLTAEYRTSKAKAS